MDLDDFKAWTVCWEVNLVFFRPVTDPITCIVCSKTSTPEKGTRRSSFWAHAVRCAAGHGQNVQTSDPATGVAGVCAGCDQDFVYMVLKGEQQCRRNGCRRKMHFHERIVKERLANDAKLLRSFLRLIKRHDVYDCSICGDEKELGSSIAAQNPTTPECNHDRDSCDSCLKDMIEAKIQSDRIRDLLCPEPECRKAIPKKRIKELISTDCYKIYNKKLTIAAMSNDPNFRWCSCGHGQIHRAGDTEPEWKCLSCKERRCFTCRDSVGASCEHLRAIDAQRKNDKDRQREAAKRVLMDKERQKRQVNEATQTLELQMTKKCPKAGCNNKIMRAKGCGHFTCNVCTTEFCWVCKVIWKNKVPLHAVGCSIGKSRTIEKASLDTTDYAVGWDNDPGYDKTLDAGVWLLRDHM